MTTLEIGLCIIIGVLVISLVTVIIRYDNLLTSLLEKHDEVVESAESQIDGYYRFFEALQERVNGMLETMRQIDNGGAFEADDEVGYIFIELKNIINDLGTFMDLEVDEIDVAKEVEELESNIEKKRKEESKRAEVEFQKRFASKNSVIKNDDSKKSKIEGLRTRRTISVIEGLKDNE